MSKKTIIVTPTQVFNADYSSNSPYNTIEGESPLQWWKSRKGWASDREVRCCNPGCKEVATDGAHVIDMETGQHVYIIPLCHEHNESVEPIDVTAGMLEECTNVESQGELIALNKDKYRKLNHR